MAKVTFMDGIATISGRIGDVVFRTSPSGKTYACKAPKCVSRKPYYWQILRYEKHTRRSLRRNMQV